MSTSTERGSGLVMALFAIALLTAIGVALLALADTEVETSVSDSNQKQSFYYAESGIEDAREAVRLLNIAAGQPDLSAALTQAAGGDGALNFDPSALSTTLNSKGEVTGFSGYGDDAPIVALSNLDDGSYIAFLRNDPPDTVTSVADSNDRILISAVGVAPDGAQESVDAVIESVSIDMPPPAAVITVMGQTPTFDGGNSNAKEYLGDDCAAGGPSLPTVGAMGPAAEATAETGVKKPGSYSSGGDTGVDTVGDVSSTIDPRLGSCPVLRQLGQTIRASAHVIGNSSTPVSELGSPTDPRIVFIEGDYTMSGNVSLGGILWVTGTLTTDGKASYSGLIYVVGRGVMDRNGAGNGNISGSIFVANVSGPDGIFLTADDCGGPQSGFWDASFTVSGGGNSTTQFCSTSLNQALAALPLRVVNFRQN